MDNAIKEIFNDQIVESVAKKYGTHSRELTYIGGFQNFIYEYQCGGKPYILRLTPSAHRTVNTVKAELEWIQYLARNGILVSSPIRSMDGVLNEVIYAREKYFTAVSFEKAEGRKIGYPECLQDNVLYEKLLRTYSRGYWRWEFLNK